MKKEIKGYYGFYAAAAVFYITTIVKCLGTGEFDTISFCVGTTMLCSGCAEAQQEKKAAEKASSKGL